ncbi:MAG: type IV pilus twitching motility protein PilT [Candidatus Omnitrophota bacterium]
MSSNIEKLLDQLLYLKGEQLVIGILEPLYVLKSGKKIPVMNRPLNDREFNGLEAEFMRIFSREEFVYKDNAIQTVKNGLQREYRLASLVPEPPDEFAPIGEALPPPIPVSARTWDIQQMLRLMIDRKASDLHLSSGCKPVMRIDGDMIILNEFPEIASDYLYDQVSTIAPERNIREFDEISDTDFAYSIPDAARYRVNVFRDIHGVGAVFRIIPSNILSVDTLKIPAAVVKLCEIPKGLVLVTGPTGSGKSTTLAALINHINETQRKHIITIEDPVEFVHPNKLAVVNQREINTHTQSFKHALRAALREDPDIILVGEMRDLETIAIAIEMAVTGHLVFGTLHTSTAIGTVDRIIDQFPSEQQQQIRTMLADALIGVVSQTLLKRKAGGRVAGYEVLIMTPAISNLIREGKNYQIATLMQTGKGLGMQMINAHLLELVEKGISDPDEALSKATDKENLKSLLKGKGLIKE